jgi:hypothetical protein
MVMYKNEIKNTAVKNCADFGSISNTYRCDTIKYICVQVQNEHITIIMIKN